jgi:acyl transferase domain-containing protein
LATTRAHHEERLTLCVSSREELERALGEVGRGETPLGGVRGRVEAKAGKLAWLFTGQGAQALGMGRGLYAEWPVFREALDEAMAALDAHLERPLREVMWAEAGTLLAAKVDETGYTQPALFALEVALAALWRSWGVEPELLAGHSIGELAAAYVGGVFSLGDAARLVSARGRLMQALPVGGAMVAIGASEREVASEVEAHSAEVSIAAVNGPESVVISGAEAAVLTIAERMGARGVRTKRLVVSHAFHSPLMAPMLGEFRQVAESIQYGRPRVAMVSNVSGRLCGAEIGTAEYWVRHVREAVRFGDGVRALHEAGARRFLEVGPKATLLGLVPSCLPSDKAEEGVLLASLRAERSEVEAVLEALGGYWVHGGAVDWQGVFPAGGRRVELPTYAWQRVRFWVDAPGPQGELERRRGTRCSECVCRRRVPMRCTSRCCRGRSSRGSATIGWAVRCSFPEPGSRSWCARRRSTCTREKRRRCSRWRWWSP